MIKARVFANSFENIQPQTLPYISVKNEGIFPFEKDLDKEFSIKLVTKS